MSVNSTLHPSSARSVTGIYENRVYPGIPKLLRALLGAGKVLVLATSKRLHTVSRSSRTFIWIISSVKLWVAILTAAGPKKAEVIAAATITA